MSSAYHAIVVERELMKELLDHGIDPSVSPMSPPATTAMASNERTSTTPSKLSTTSSINALSNDSQSSVRANVDESSGPNLLISLTPNFDEGTFPYYSPAKTKSPQVAATKTTDKDLNPGTSVDHSQPLDLSAKGILSSTHFQGDYADVGNISTICQNQQKLFTKNVDVVARSDISRK